MADTLLRIADPAVGVVLGACGAVLSVRRRPSLVGPLMLLACICWFLGSVWSLMVFLHRGPLVHIHISYPTGRIRRSLAVVAVVSAYLTAIVEGIASNPWITLAMAILVALAATDIYARTSGPARRAGKPALGAALAFASVLALSAANRLLLWQDDLLVLILYDVTVCVVAVVLTADLLAGRWTAATVADFVTQLGNRPDTGAMTMAVRRALGDPTARVGFWLADQQRYVDDHRESVEPPGDQADRSVTMIDDHGRRAALLIHCATSDQQLISDVVSALRIAMGNARLRTDIRTHIVELGHLRRRLVEAADLQQRRLESDLASGPMLRLSSTYELLARAIHQSDAGADANQGLRTLLEPIRDEIVQAQVDLHELTLGVRPAVLDTGGLAAALPLLAARASPTRVTLEVTPARLVPAIEGAVYFVCAEALTNLGKHAHASAASIEVTVERGVVTTRITDNGIGGADPAGSGLRGLRDRTEALDGTLVIADRQTGGTLLEARIPLRAGPSLPEEAT